MIPERQLAGRWRALQERASQVRLTVAGTVGGIGVHVVAVGGIGGVVATGPGVGVGSGATEPGPLEGPPVVADPAARAVLKVAVVAARRLLLPVGAVSHKVAHLVAGDAGAAAGAGESALVGADGGQSVAASGLHGQVVDGNVAVAHGLDDTLDDDAVVLGHVADCHALHCPAWVRLDERGQKLEL